MSGSRMIRAANRENTSPREGSNENRREALARTGIFQDLPDDALDTLVRISRSLTASAGTVLCRQNDAATDLFLLMEGQVALSNTIHPGASAVVEVVQPGGHFVLTPLLARLPYLMNAETTAPSHLIALRADGLLDLIQRDTRIASAALRAEAMDFSAMVRQVCDLKLRTTAQRLGAYLLELTQPSVTNTASFRLPFDKRLLAARLGCRQENLSRAFAALRELGVETHGARVILHDIGRLRAYARPEEPLGQLA